MKVLIAAGDIGGAKAILPALTELADAGCLFDILDHGCFAEQAGHNWPKFRTPPTAEEIKHRLGHDYDAYVFSTSVHDTLPLGLARLSRECRVPVICVLDNWMNYRWRLVMDGGPLFLPDAYAVMDELAKQEAIIEGLPEAILHVTGHPALAGLQGVFRAANAEIIRKRIINESGMLEEGRKLIVFVSEPAEKDQGSDRTFPNFRGYTEKSVLRLLAGCLQEYADRVQIGLLAHPREDERELYAVWEGSRGRLIGGLMKPRTGREAVIAADGICGMASILLFEAMLVGKPVLSLQPNLATPSLEFLKKKGLPFFVTNEQTVPTELRRWLAGLFVANDTLRNHPDLALHDQAPSALAKLIFDVASSRALD